MVRFVQRGPYCVMNDVQSQNYLQSRSKHLNCWQDDEIVTI